MRILLASVFLIPVLCLSQPLHSKGQTPSLDKVREQFFGMNQSKDGALNLYFRLKPLDLSNAPVLLAYRGAASAAAAGSVSGVNKKLSYFSNGKSELEQAVKRLPGDVEIRFLRLATQLNAPSFLGYRSSIDQDKSIIINLLSQFKPNEPNAYLYFRISGFLLDTDILNAVERKKVVLIKEKFGN
jgi:hypothetical protein